MSHLRLVPPLPAEPAVPEQQNGRGGVWGPRLAEEPGVGAPGGQSDKVALLFFQAATGMCLCRDCTKRRHPAFGGL